MGSIKGRRCLLTGTMPILGKAGMIIRPVLFETRSSSFYRRLGFPAGAINAAALAAATEQRTAPIAAAIPKAESKADPDDAITGPIRDVATNPPVRATALFSPDAAPVWLPSTDINTAVVSGATAPAIQPGTKHLAPFNGSCS